MDSRTPTKKIQ